MKRPVALLASFVVICLMASPPLQAEDPPTGKSAVHAPEPPSPIRDRGYHLAQNWDFGATIRSKEDLDDAFYAYFVYEHGTLDHLARNGEWQRYSPDNRRIAGNGLELVAELRDGLRDGGITSGLIRSKWTGKYGYFECRMRVPRGRGLWPAFWINPEDGEWPPEIDVVEIVDNGRDTTRSSFHNLYPSRDEDKAEISSRLDRWGGFHSAIDYADRYHVFAVEWTPEGVTHYVDNQKIAERRFAWKHRDGSDAGPAHVLVNLAVGGGWPGPPDSTTEFPAVLRIDYIRVWQR